MTGIMPADLQFNREKLQAAILHVCNTCPPDQLGAVKLHKTLYFADMIRYAQTRRPLTGATYRKRPFGPTCVQLLPSIRDLERAGAIEVREVDYFGYAKKDYIALETPPSGVLAADEIALLDEVIAFVCTRNSARSISEFSHQAPWERAEFGGDIPYSTAYLLFPSIVSEEVWEATAQGVRQVEEAGQAGQSVDFTDFAVLRHRFRAKDGELPA